MQSPEQIIDFSKLTISQKIDVENYRNLNKGVSLSIKKEYQERQKMIVSDEKMLEEQKEAEIEVL